MASGGMAHPTVEKVNDDAMFVDKLPEEINEMKIKNDKVEKVVPCVFSILSFYIVRYFVLSSFGASLLQLLHMDSLL
ncbi:hypothetical protein HanPI659440_Chr14g0529451 [Helianthus annuus]|nr:hypothetical protein HanPI659440_Chr14g0529451 [Helianthus annuus]